MPCLFWQNDYEWIRRWIHLLLGCGNCMYYSHHQQSFCANFIFILFNIFFNIVQRKMINKIEVGEAVCSSLVAVGRLWIGTGNGSIMLFDEQMKQVQHIPNAHTSMISTMVEAKGQVWSASFDSSIHVWTLHVCTLLLKLRMSCVPFSHP